MTLVSKFSGNSPGASGDPDTVMMNGPRWRYGNIRKMFRVLIFHFQTCATSKKHSDQFHRQLKTAVKPCLSHTCFHYWNLQMLFKTTKNYYYYLYLRHLMTT